MKVALLVVFAVFMVLLLTLPGCAPVEPPKTFAEVVAYADGQVTAMEQTVVSLACPTPQTCGSGPLPVELAKSYYAKLVDARGIIRQAETLPATGGSCGPGTAATPAACLALAQATLSEIASFVKGYQGAPK